MAVYREIGIATCTSFDWEKDPGIKAYSRKVMRLVVLHFCITLEYFRRSGSDEDAQPEQMDRMRKDIQRITGPNEYKSLYPMESHDVTGSESQYPHTHPMVVVFWIDLVFSRCFKAGGVLSPPHAASMSALTTQLLGNFRQMDQIDKTQFPLPYAQLVKILLSAWVFSLPFVLELYSYAFTPVAMFIISLALFGLDEVAEVMESPFGLDPNAIYLEDYREDLVNDLELMFYSREMKMDTVFTNDKDLCLRGITNSGTPADGPSNQSLASGHAASRFASMSSYFPGATPRVRLEAPAVADMRAAIANVIEDAELAARGQEPGQRRGRCEVEEAGAPPAAKAKPVKPGMARVLPSGSCPMSSSGGSTKSSIPTGEVTGVDCPPRLDPRGSAPLDGGGDGELECAVEVKSAGPSSSQSTGCSQIRPEQPGIAWPVVPSGPRPLEPSGKSARSRELL